MIGITKADQGDLESILNLQYLAYQSEADLFGSRDIPPLRQTLEELTDEYANGSILKMTDDTGEIIGSVRAHEDNGTVYIGKLMVHPDHQKKGHGSRLLSAIEKYCPGKRYELFTSTRSTDNIRLYKRMGYREFKQEHITEELVFVYMQKFPVYLSESCDVFYVEDKNVVLVNWKKYCELEQYRTPLEHTLEVIKEHPGCNYVADTRNGFEDNPLDTIWVADHFMPCAKESGCNIIYFIIDKNNSLKEELEGQANDSAGLLEFRYIYDLEEVIKE